MPEWQGAGVGTFLNQIMQYHLEGNGRCQRKISDLFSYLTPATLWIYETLPKWKQVSAKLTGDNKARSIKSLQNTSKGFEKEK